MLPNHLERIGGGKVKVNLEVERAIGIIPTLVNGIALMYPMGNMVNTVTGETRQGTSGVAGQTAVSLQNDIISWKFYKTGDRYE
jgi:hypothetical protein